MPLRTFVTLNRVIPKKCARIFRPSSGTTAWPPLMPLAQRTNQICDTASFLLEQTNKNRLPKSAIADTLARS